MIVRILAAALLFSCASCAGAPPPTGAGGEFKPCPASPNCVSSRAIDQAHRVDPLPLRGTAAEGLALLRQVILAMPRSRILAEGPGFLHAEFRSRIFRFVDDFSAVVDESAGVIHVRSASRVGRSDFGVNRRRIGDIRGRLAIRQSPAADTGR